MARKKSKKKSSNRNNGQTMVPLYATMIVLFVWSVFNTFAVMRTSRHKNVLFSNEAMKRIHRDFFYGGSHKRQPGRNEHQAQPALVDFLDEPLAIFYNVYIPPNNTDHAWNIVKGQLQKRQNSERAQDATLYYTQIGSNSSMPMPCDSCHRLQYRPEGDEMLTLTQLYRFCTQYPNSSVIYLHNKGSFHASEANHKMELISTRAIFSDECISGVMDRTCTTCSARFTPVPAMISPGNMFVASCGYVSQLQPPYQLNQSLHRMYDHLKRTPELHGFKSIPYGRDAWLGINRYTSEHWIHSHPWNVPCDVCRSHWRGNYKRFPKENYGPLLKKAPRHLRKFYILSENQFADDWFRARGRIYFYQYLNNNKTPRADWWGWEFYNGTN